MDMNRVRTPLICAGVAALAVGCALPQGREAAAACCSLLAAGDTPASTIPSGITGGHLAADSDQAVQSGRKALDSWYGYPWYDPKADDLRPVEIAPKEERETYDPAVPRASFLGPVLQMAGWTVIGLGLAAVLYFLVRAFVFRPREQAEAETAAADGQSPRIDALPVPVASGRLDLLAEARRQYEQGNYRQAIICLFSFQLLQLDKRQIIHLAKGKTNRQYLREVGPRQGLRWLVEQTMVAFEDVFFGNHALDRGRFEACWSRVGEFERLTAET
jgi:hypothetical protein